MSSKEQQKQQSGQRWRSGDSVVPPAPPLGYVLKRLLLGRPLITDQLKNERLSNPVALGVLSPDAISSSAYGTEETLIELLQYAGLAAFALLLPITGVILVILVLVTASYREVVLVYTRAGGSYVVARENFGPRVAQVAAAALLIDYVVTVAVQAAAGTVAVVSALPTLGPYSLEITVGVVVVLCVVNLRGLREAGRPFALPTYFFCHDGHRGDCGRRGAALDHRSAPVQPGHPAWCRRGGARERDHHGCHGLGGSAGVRQRWLVTHRRRGDLQHRQCPARPPRPQRPQSTHRHWRVCWGS